MNPSVNHYDTLRCMQGFNSWPKYHIEAVVEISGRLGIKVITDLWSENFCSWKDLAE